MTRHRMETNVASGRGPVLRGLRLVFVTDPLGTLEFPACSLSQSV